MNNVYDISDQDRRYDEASTWIARIDRELSTDEEAELRTFLADDRNRELFLEMARLWDKMDALSRLAEILPDVEHRPRRSHGLAIAASLIVAAVAVAWFAVPWLTGDRPEFETIAQTTAVYETAVGEQSTVSLSDGTVLVLNTDSRVRVSYSHESRYIDLDRGEIHVTVARDPLRPLMVRTDSSIIQALGTQFNVEITSDRRVEVIVVEGVVLIGVNDPESAVAQTRLAPESATRLTGGSRAVLGPAEEQVERIEPREIEVKLSWTDGNIVFRGESLEEAIAEVGRYTDVEFVFLDDRARQVRVVGRFKTGDVDSLLANLEANLDISYQRLDDDEVLLSSR